MFEGFDSNQCIIDEVTKEYAARKMPRYQARNMFILAGKGPIEAEKLIIKIDEDYKKGLN